MWASSNSHRMQYVFAVLCLIVPPLLLLSCKDTVTNVPGNGNDITFPDTGLVSYSQQVQPLFNLKCNFSGCHGRDTYNLRGWDLTEYGRFAITGQNIVIPGDTVNSRLIRAIKGLGPSPRMPENADPLPNNQIRGLTRWVQQGARQDT